MIAPSGFWTMRMSARSSNLTPAPSHACNRANFWLLDWLQAKHPYFGVRKDSMQAAESWRSELSEKQQKEVLSIAGRFPGFAEYWPDAGAVSLHPSVPLPLPASSDHHCDLRNG